MPGLVTRISRQVGQMTKSQKKVANYLMFNIDKLMFCTVDDLAGAAGVSTATVVRFARELGFEGFADLQKAACQRFLDGQLEEDVTASEFADDEEGTAESILKKSFQQDIDNLEKTYQSLSREALQDAWELLKTAKRVYIVGMRISRSVATYAYINWGMIRRNVRLVHNDSLDYAEELERLSAEDLMVVFWAPRYNKSTYQMISYARKKSAHVLIITNQGFNAGVDATMYDVILPCYMKNSSYQSSFVAHITLINYLTRRLEREFSKDLASRLSLWDSMLGEDFFLT